MVQLSYWCNNSIRAITSASRTELLHYGGNEIVFKRYRKLMYSDVSLIRNPLNRKPRYPEMVFWLHISFANSEDPD